MINFHISEGLLIAENLTPGSLNECILKWKRLHQEALYGNLVFDGGQQTCSLCAKYNKIMEDDGGCEGCIIYEFTDRHYCQATPYRNYESAVDSDDVKGAIVASAEMLHLLKLLQATIKEIE